MMAFIQVESILQPVHIGEGKREQIIIQPSNIERLAKESDLISSYTCRVKVINEKIGTPGANAETVHKVKIEGADFGYEFAPAAICGLRKQVEKSFKAVESFTKKAGKVMNQAPARVPETAPKQATEPIIEAPAPEPEPEIKPATDNNMLINQPLKVINDTIILPKDSETDYICDTEETTEPDDTEPESKFWVCSSSTLKNLNHTPTTLDEFLSESWRDFATA
jgi:hypothetical protein